MIFLRFPIHREVICFKAAEFQLSAQKSEDSEGNDGGNDFRPNYIIRNQHVSYIKEHPT